MKKHRRSGDLFSLDCEAVTLPFISLGLVWSHHSVVERIRGALTSNPSEIWHLFHLFQSHNNLMVLMQASKA